MNLFNSGDYIVSDSLKVFGYFIPADPNYAKVGVLADHSSGGYVSPLNGPRIISDQSSWRKATDEDFDTYRIENPNS